MNTINSTRNREAFVPRACLARMLALVPKGQPIATALFVGSLLTALLTVPAQAQFIRFKGGQVRVTVPLNSGNSTSFSNQVNRAGIDANGVTLTVSGVTAGATVLLSTNQVFTNNTPLTITVNTTNIPQGEYAFRINAGGLDTNGVPTTNFFPIIIQSCHIWNGTNNAAAGGPGNWSDGTQWLGGVSANGDDVVFNDLGGQTNQLLGGTAYLVNSIFDTDLTLSSLRFAMTNSATKAQTIQLNPGRKLTITGTNGFRFLRDYVSANAIAANIPMNVTVLGTNATLVVSNKNGVFALLSDNNAPGSTTFNNMNSLDLTWVDNFYCEVNRIGLGDYQLWPYYDVFSGSNAFNGTPKNFAAFVNLARTNLIKAYYRDPNNFTNSTRRDYSLCLGNNEYAGTSSNPQYTINFGLTNAFFIDSICFGHASLSSSTKFAPLFATNYACVAYFRGTNGGRMSMWAQSDLGQGGLNAPSGSNDKNSPPVDFSGGRLDVMADTVALSRDRINSSGCNAQSVLVMGPGIFDVNTAYIGYQTENFHTNVQYCQGSLIVSNTGVFKVNGTMTLGYTAEDPTNTAATSQNNRGTITIGSGGTVMANKISVGGLTKLSAGNSITITNGNLIVSNSVAGSDKMLDSLTLSGGAIVTLHLDLNNPNPYVFVTNLTTTGSNVVQIASIRNLGSLSGNIPLVQYSAGNGSFQGLIMPPGLGGALITTNNVGIYLSILTNTPKDLIWRGYLSQDWDLTTKNWLDQATGLHTNFSNGDRLTFDDDGSTPTTIHLAGPIDIVPGNGAMSNNVNHYIIDGASGGDIQGSATLAEWGSAGVQIDGAMTLTVQLNAGTLTGSGSIGSAVVAPGSVMTYAGSIGAGLTVGGTATLSGNSSGTLSVQGTGIVTNSGTYAGPFNTAAGSLLVNNATWLSGGNSTVVSNAVMINNGGFHALTLTVGGTLKDTGIGGIYMYGDVVSGTRGLTINNGGIFIPGGDGTGTTTVYPELGSPNNFPGRMLFSTGSTNIFKLDPSIPANTLLGSATMGFGPNQNTKAENGGTILVTNVSGAPFMAGQSFTMFQYYQGGFLGDAGLNTTNSYPIMSPAAPGSGLVWDLSNLIPNGVIGIHETATNPFNAGFSAGTVFGLVLTNAAATNSFTTNNYVITHLTWPTNYIGWNLQQQVNPINVGLSTNWSTVFGSFWTNEWYFTNILTTNCAFYRMTYP